MRKVLIIALIVLLIPIFLVTFTVIHELGHTLLARLLGDPNSVFYLAKIEEDTACLGCNIYDQSKLSWGGNLVVSLGGLLASQLTALSMLLLFRLRPGLLWKRIFGTLALAFAFLDVPVQVLQGLLYNLSHNSFPTNVDLLDFMLLLQQKTSASQLFLKGLLLGSTLAYLAAFLWTYLYFRSRRKAEISP